MIISDQSMCQKGRFSRIRSHIFSAVVHLSLCFREPCNKTETLTAILGFITNSVHSILAIVKTLLLF